MQFPPLVLATLRQRGFKRQWFAKHYHSEMVQYEIFLDDRKLEVRLEARPNGLGEIIYLGSVTHAQVQENDSNRLVWSTVPTEFSDIESMVEAINYEKIRMD